MKIAIVGAGISAHYFLYHLSQTDLKCEVVWIYDNDIYPSNDNKITPIISLNGIKEGNSTLGDLLYDSYYRTVNELVPEFQNAFKRGSPIFSYE